MSWKYITNSLRHHEFCFIEKLDPWCTKTAFRLVMHFLQCILEWHTVFSSEYSFCRVRLFLGAVESPAHALRLRGTPTARKRQGQTLALQIRRERTNQTAREFASADSMGAGFTFGFHLHVHQDFPCSVRCVSIRWSAMRALRRFFYAARC